MKKMPMMQRKALIGWIFCIPFSDRLFPVLFGSGCSDRYLEF